MAGAWLLQSELAGAASVSSSGVQRPRREMSFDENWRFMRGDIPGAEALRYEDGDWGAVHLPHDWSIEDLPRAPATTAPWVAPAAIWNPRPAERASLFDIQIPATGPDGPPLRVGPFDPVASAGGGNTGWVLGGTAWYRKRFATPQLRAGERVDLRFDGVFRDTEVWLNGVSLGTNIYGFAGFSFDLTDHLRAGHSNVLAVRVRNEGETSRWYTGSGLYRHVWLTVTQAIRIVPWGVWACPTRIASDRADVVVTVDIENTLTTARAVDVRVLLHDPSGAVVAIGVGQASLLGQGQGGSVVTLSLVNPVLWGPDHPALYTAEVTLASGGREMDRISMPFGIRTIAASAEQGLTINGVPVKLKGACLHADNGILGAAAIDRAEVRKVAILKSFGYNALRMGHQMFSPAFMQACDEAGMLVIDEVFDTWEQAKWLKNDYSRAFKTHWKKDLERFVRQHRNHPSVIFWSIGNEIPEAAEPRGVEIAASMRTAVLAMDPTRLITEAIAVPLISGEAGEVARRSLDVAGYNYGQDTYERDHAKYPHTVMMGTEQWSRDMYAAWGKVEAYPWVIGDFVWTGMDYIGEVGSGSSELRPTGGELPKTSYVTSLWDYPAYLSGCGEIDITGRRKPQGLYRDVLWGRSALELLVQRPTYTGTYERVSDWGWHDELESWTWPELPGHVMTIRAYTTGDAVTLLLNGREVAHRSVTPQDQLKAEFSVPYVPGKLVAVAYRHGTEIGRKTLATVGPAARLRLRAERMQVDASPDDLAYVFAEVCDAHGGKVPDASVPMVFAVSGAAALRATGSANPRGLKSFRSPECATFHGEALAIVQPGLKPGRCTITVTSPGLTSGIVEIVVG